MSRRRWGRRNRRSRMCRRKRVRKEELWEGGEEDVRGEGRSKRKKSLKSVPICRHELIHGCDRQIFVCILFFNFPVYRSREREREK